MSNWPDILQRPPNVPGTDPIEVWFTRMATALLTSARLVVGGEPHRFTEIEFYYHGPDHPDLFAHRDPVQLHCGRWYFHRTGGVYRSGSFKGVDLSFGDGRTHGGVLIRGLEAPDGSLIDGPSLLVDHLLKKSGYHTVAALDEDIGTRLAWDESSPLTLRQTPPEPRSWIRSGRVGLTLKRSRPNSDGPRFVLRPYRFLSEPKRISKGKVLMVVALHAQGKNSASIQQLTGSPLKTVQRYIADFEEGRRNPAFGPFFGKDLGPKELCQLSGVWHAVWQEGATPR
jgi:hypothetical protein